MGISHCIFRFSSGIWSRNSSVSMGIIKLLGGEYAFAAGLLLIYVLTQVIRQVVQPKLVGDSLGLNPILTLLFLYLGFKLKGIAGMILAVPCGMFL